MISNNDGVHLIVAGLCTWFFVQIVRFVCDKFRRRLTLSRVLGMLNHSLPQDFGLVLCLACNVKVLYSRELWIEIIFDEHGFDDAAPAIQQKKILIWNRFEGIRDYSKALVLCYYNQESATGCRMEKEIEILICGLIIKKMDNGQGYLHHGFDFSRN